jgi:hypothetical protein
MSDMIDRLRAVANGAGRDVAHQLSDAATIGAMAGRVARGAHRRRVRRTIGLTAGFVVAAAAAIAVPLMLRVVPVEIEPGRTIVHSSGPLTVYDDGSMSVVLSNGTFFDVAPDPSGSGAFYPFVSEQACSTDVASLTSPGWHPDSLDYGRLVSSVQVIASVNDENTTLTAGSSIEVPAWRMYPEAYLSARLEADPAIAPYLVVQTRWVESRDGRVEFFDHQEDAQPGYVLQGDPVAGTQRAIMTTQPTMLSTETSWCNKDAPKRVGEFDDLVIVDVWLVDRVGVASHLGTYTQTFSVTWKEPS